jgi:type IV secretory pathway TrbD component
VNDARPPGFEVPVFRSLYEPNMIAGVSRRFAGLLWCPTLVAVAQSFRALWFVLVIAAVIHAAVALATNYDPDFIQVVGRAMRAPRRLDP